MECADCSETLGVTLVKISKVSEKHAMVGGACTYCGSTGRVAASSVTIPSKVTLGAKQTYQLKPTVKPANCTDKCTYSTSKKSVATVSASGKITAKKTGKAVITVKCGSRKDTITVTVKKAPSSIKFTAAKVYVGVGTTTIVGQTYNGIAAACTVTVKKAPSRVDATPSTLTIGVGQSCTLKASVNSGAAGRIYFQSLDTARMSVNSSGKVTARAAGSEPVQLRAYAYNGVDSFCDVYIKPAPSCVRLNASKGTLKVGKTFQLKVTLGADGEDCAGSYSFSTNNPKVAAVSASGKITAKKAGKATITVRTHNGKTAVCVVTVKK